MGNRRCPAPARTPLGRYVSRPVRYPVETFTEAEAHAPRSARHEPRRAGLRARQPAGDRQGRAVRALLALPGNAAPPVPRRVRRLAAGAPARPGTATRAPRRRALRAHLRRLRRRLGRPARRRARRLRVGLERPDEDPPAPADGRLPRAVDALHRLRRADARRRLPLLPRRASSGREYERAMDEVFGDLRRARCRASCAWVEETYPAPEGGSPAAHARAVQAKALDLLRGLLPAASLSHMGIFATGQTYEQLILHLLAHPLPEARHYGRMILAHDAGRDAELRRARRAPRPRRRVGRATWSAASRPRARWVARLGLDREPGDDGHGGPSVTLLHVDGDEDALLASLLFEAAGVSERQSRASASRALGAVERAALLGDLVGERAQPPPPPGPRLRGAALPLRDRLGLRRVPRPAAPPPADRAVAGARPGPRRRRPGGGRGRGRRRRLPPRARRLARRVRAPASGRPRAARRSTRSASATASATCSTSTRARRCTSSSCAPAARAIPATAPSRTRCTARSRQVHPAVAERDAPRRHDRRAAARAHPQRDARAGEARRPDPLSAQRTLSFSETDFAAVARGVLGGELHAVAGLAPLEALGGQRRWRSRPSCP